MQMKRIVTATLLLDQSQETGLDARSALGLPWAVFAAVVRTWDRAGRPSDGLRPVLAREPVRDEGPWELSRFAVDGRLWALPLWERSGESVLATARPLGMSMFLALLVRVEGTVERMASDAVGADADVRRARSMDSRGLLLFFAPVALKGRLVPS